MDQILWDFSPVDTVQVISESKTSGEMYIRGVFGRANEVNNNRRVYPKVILEREVTKLQPLITENRLLGELEHPERTNVSLANASHLVTKLYWQGNTIIGEAKILNTPSGKIAQQLIKDGVKLGVSSRGTGSLKESKEHPGVSEVTDSYKMLTFDLVADPSTRGAFPTLVSESTKIALEKSKKEVAVQNLVVKLFESKMSEVKENKLKTLFEGSLGFKRAERKMTALWKKGKNRAAGDTGSKHVTKVAVKGKADLGTEGEEFRRGVKQGSRKRFNPFVKESKDKSASKNKKKE